MEAELGDKGVLNGEFFEEFLTFGARLNDISLNKQILINYKHMETQM